VARDVAYAMENLDRESKRQRAEDALWHERNYLRQILDAQFGFVVVLGLDGTVVDINQTCLMLMGLTRAEVVGRSFWEIGWIDPRSAKQVREAFQAAIGGDTPRRDMIARFPGMSPRHVDLVFSPLWNETGRITQVVGVGMDITDRKRGEEALVTQERRFRSLLEATHDAIMVWDPIRGVRYMNPAAETLTGIKFAEVAAKELAAVLKVQSGAELSEAQQVFRVEGSWTGELALLGPEGERRHVASRWTTLTDVDGGRVSILITCNDVTERKRLEAQYLRAQRLESLGTLAGGVAHDLNNILSPILMGLDMLNLATTDPTTLTTLAMIKESARRGVDTVRQLLTFSRGGTESNRGPVDPGHLVEEIVRLLRQTLPKNIQIEAEVMDLSVMVYADSSQVHQVLLNLCVNARDAMPEGGLLFIKVEDRVLNEIGARIHPKARPIEYVIITVTDSGTGIPPEILDRIFDPFFTTKPQGQGTGLGLATVLGIVESHEGFVLVESSPGRGTTFRVHLPAVRSSAPVLGQPAASPVPRGAWGIGAGGGRRGGDFEVGGRGFAAWRLSVDDHLAVLGGDSFGGTAPARDSRGVDRHDDAVWGRPAAHQPAESAISGVTRIGDERSARGGGGAAGLGIGRARIPWEAFRRGRTPSGHGPGVAPVDGLNELRWLTQEKRGALGGRLVGVAGKNWGPPGTGDAGINWRRRKP
jgi:PAS domain S-box-containing protein